MSVRKILAIIRRDFQHVRHNTIALLVCMGLIVIPSLYAWFNIAGGWDPYGNTRDIKVALANCDEGVKGSILPFQVNAGQRVVDALAGSEKIGYVVTSEEDALAGVRSGEYYAAVVIPKNFSTNLLSVLSKDPSHPQLDYYVNEKRNAIASIVTGKASGSVQTMVNTGFSEAVASVAADLFNEVSSVLDDDGVMEASAGLVGALNNSLGYIQRSADDIKAYASAVVSIRSVVDSSANLFGDSSASISAADMLHESADGVRKFDEAAQTAKNGASSAIDRGSGAVDEVKVAIDNAFATADGEVDKIVDGLSQARDAAQARVDSLNGFIGTLEGLNGDVVNLENSLAGDSGDLGVAFTVENDISDLISRTANARDYMNDLIATCGRTIDDLQSSKISASDARARLQEMSDRAAAGVESARQGYEDKLSGSLNDIAGVIDGAAEKASGISDSIKGEADKVKPVMNDASKGLKSLEDSLNEASKKLSDASGKLKGLHDQISQASSSGDVNLVRSILGGDAESLISFISAPAQLERHAFFPVENNGSAMTPYYTTMALWVGGTLLGLLTYVAISKKTEEETGAKPHHAYFGRLAFFLAIGFLQSTMILLGDLFFLRVQCENPILFLLTGWLASTVFINIIYSLATSFGDAGKAVAVFIMVVQVAGSGGTFPVEMLPKPFQIAYPFLPFVHSETAMRAAMFGVYGNEWIRAMGILAAFLVPALLLGLVLSRPFAPINEWIEEKLEETKLM